jgi:hypothetical protein
MTLKSIGRAWNDFFFAPQSPVPIAIFRILFSLMVLADAALLRPEWLTWFGPRGIVSLEAMQQVERGARINLFAFLPETAFWTNAVFWMLVVSALLLAVGLYTRASSIAVYVLLASLHERNLFITNSGDTLLRASAFFLMFAPAGAALSLDRLRNIWRGRETAEIRPRAPWAQRMIQIELCLMYLMTFWNKSLGPAWIDGTALYYVYHLDQFRRFPVPDFFQELKMVRLETWFTLAAEFALGVLVWIKELRYPVLAIGVVLHLSLEYSMNVPLFQWIALSLYITFVDGADLARVWATVRDRPGAGARTPVVVAYDPEVATASRAAEVLKALDIFGRLRLVPQRDAAPGSLVRVALQLWGIAAPASAGAGLSTRSVRSAS